MKKLMKTYDELPRRPEGANLILHEMIKPEDANIVYRLAGNLVGKGCGLEHPDVQKERSESIWGKGKNYYRKMLRAWTDITRIYMEIDFQRLGKALIQLGSDGLHWWANWVCKELKREHPKEWQEILMPKWKTAGGPWLKQPKWDAGEKNSNPGQQDPIEPHLRFHLGQENLPGPMAERYIAGEVSTADEAIAEWEAKNDAMVSIMWYTGEKPPPSWLGDR